MLRQLFGGGRWETNADKHLETDVLVPCCLRQQIFGENNRLTAKTGIKDWGMRVFGEEGL